MQNTTNILKNIVHRKRAEVALQKVQQPIYTLMESPHFLRASFSAKEALLGSRSSGIIAEFKRQSPSKGLINGKVRVNDVVTSYQEAGASMVSVLTDEHFFGAQSNDFAIARDVLNIPLLRKDFTVDPYQIYQAKAMGADVILLIAAILEPDRCRDLAFLAHDLGMEVLLELHDESELEYVNEFVDLVGINNRNLEDFSVDTERSLRLAKQLPSNLIRVAESGLSDVATVQEMKEKGFQAFLMGEYFMRHDLPGTACRDFIRNLQRQS
ncbi:MAG: indole-3-glycerol phosphate synthase TrpC [Marinifilaceae bacterium]